MTKPTRSPYKGVHINSAYHEPIRQSWRAGYNTSQIAKAFKVKEPDVVRIITAEQERRYREWADAAPAALAAATA